MVSIWVFWVLVCAVDLSCQLASIVECVKMTKTAGFVHHN